ncbi:MAG: helix-turn-helix transcriptional regulator [bacterium]|nr:helix-turn-helix transcriptional regulator [bacterium]
MSIPILTTKLYIPPLQTQRVRRPRLMERLNEGLPKQNSCFAQNNSFTQNVSPSEGRFTRKLTLISAPAGFGKTTLVSEWLADCERFEPPVRVAWLSLDQEDNDLTHFLAYLIAASQTIEPEIGEGVTGLLQSSQSPSTESILTALINDIVTVPDNFILVLDDYHVIDAAPIDRALTFLLDHLPPRMHLVIATREDPQFPQARLRARSQMTELRAADLRFTPSEAADFLNRTMDLNLSSEDVAALESRTEGWIAGLQLAALALQGPLQSQGQQDTASFVTSFTGSHRFVMDYLLEEVLHQQPEHIQTFLLRTSILDRLCGSLCEAVVCFSETSGSSHRTTAMATSSASGQDTLEYLERTNLFIVQLDNERRWYRYHHLFADLLRQRLRQRSASSIGDDGLSVAELHRRASMWYEDNGLEIEALHHAFAAEDFERAAGLVELTWLHMNQNFQEAAWLGWVKSLPDELVRARPVLSVGYAWELLDNGEVEAVEARLRDAERWLDTSADTDEMVVADEEQFRSLPATIANIRANRALALGDVLDVVKYARHALDLTPEKDHFRRGAITGVLGVAYWMSGDLEAAYRSYADCMANLKMAGNIHLALSLTFVLADIRVTQGRLREAVSAYELSLQLAAEQAGPVSLATADLYVGLGGLRREQDDLETATQHLLKSKELGEQTALPDWQYRWHLVQARIKVSQGDPDGALDQLDEAEPLYSNLSLPDVRPVAALKTRVWLQQGRLTEALDWVREQGLSVDDDLNYMREFEHVTLARVLLAKYKSDRTDRSILEVRGFLDRLLEAAEEGKRIGSAIEILVLQALAHKAQGNIPSALASLKRALALAEPEGYIRIFVDEGMPMAHLLSEAAIHDIMPNYIGKLQAIFDAEKQKREDTSSPSPAQTLLDPLSPREVEVLQLIAQGLSNREICERLFLALDTVKGHNRKIFGKLDVKRRTEAVVRARELGLL